MIGKDRYFSFETVIMGYHPRIETKEHADFITSRTRNSKLWFVNNKRLEASTLGALAKYSKRYNITLYAFAVEGNHIHSVMQVNEGNRAHFMRDLKSSIAKAIMRNVSTYPGGSVWGRRYSNEFLPGDADIENWFFYTVLQPVQDGLVEKISDYPGYNCFHDAVWGIKRKYKCVNWTAYHEALRWNPVANIKDFTEIYLLEYARLPGYEELTQREYAMLMHKKLEERRREIVAKRQAEGKGFAGRTALLQTRPGSRPRLTKVSTRGSHRPRILCVCPQRRAEATTWYFDIYFKFKAASKSYRRGDREVVFPDGTYRPYVPTEETALC
jgi:REP element-mobilizing transposase RayT